MVVMGMVADLVKRCFDLAGDMKWCLCGSEAVSVE
jgi:hypothetical protein